MLKSGKNRDTGAWNCGTILGVFLGGCHWKNRGTMQRQRDTMEMWHDVGTMWHDASGSEHYLRLHSSCF